MASHTDSLQTNSSQVDDKKNAHVNTIWKKISKWNPYLKHETKEKWYDTYKCCVASIYEKRLSEIKFFSKSLKQHNKTKEITPEDYHKVVNNLMFLMCVYCVDEKMFYFFVRYFYKTIDEIGRLTNFYANTSMNFFAVLLQRPDKPIDIIKMYVKFLELDTTNNINDPYATVWIVGNNCYNCLQTAINKYDYRYRASNRATIEYMINDLKMDVTKTCNDSVDDDNILTVALGNKRCDVHLIKYLIEKVDKKLMFSPERRSEYLSRCIEIYARIKNQRSLINYCEIIGFLISTISAEQLSYFNIKSWACTFLDMGEHLCFKHMKTLFFSINEKSKMNIILDKMILSNLYRKSKIIRLIRSIDPKLLTDAHCAYARIPHFNSEYKDFIRHIDDVDGSYHVKPIINQGQVPPPINQLDNTVPSVLLFRYNDVPYYGNSAIFDQMDFFKDNEAMRDGKTEFNGDMPKYLINLYLNQTLSGQIDISSIEPGDIFKFVRFIDQYPSQVLTVDSIEDQLIQYMSLNGISMANLSPNTSHIFARYGCKYLMLSHQKRNDPKKLYKDELEYESYDDIENEDYK